MPKLIKDGAVVEDSWSGELLTPEQLPDARGNDLGVILEPDQPPSMIQSSLERVALVAVNFPVFTDGRGFSYARELRELGFEGEIRAVGSFIRDQLFYLKRCGFNAFQLEGEADLDACLGSLGDFSDAYQASVDQPEPLFRRR
jgi:uncharacterized protein (DUF934 family)